MSEKDEDSVYNRAYIKLHILLIYKVAYICNIIRLHGL